MTLFPSSCAPFRHALWMVGAASCVLLAACSGGEVADKPVGPITPVDTTKPPGTVQRATLAVTVSFDAADAGLASTASVTPAGITVRIQRVGTTEAAKTAVTGADGVARFTELLEGFYQVSADRALTTTEVARLPAADREAAVFAGGAQVQVAPPAGQTSVQLVAARRGSLVISEIYMYRGLYSWGTYIEIYNNADTTSYLDGMLLFASPARIHRDWDSDGCASTQQFRTDPQGVWARLIWAFPGTGREYPIRPGEAKVIAQDAMNHAAASTLAPVYDLSAAHFEQIGTDADIDNPFVPDMIRIAGSTGALGRGWPMTYGNIYGIALPSARARLVRDDNVSLDVAYRVPRDAIIETAGFELNPEAIARLELTLPYAKECTPWTLPEYERAPSPLGGADINRVIARRSLGRTADGREILQHTRTSARDFEVAAAALRRSLRK